MLFIGTRDNVGADWSTYDFMFREMIRMPFIVGATLTEPGYATCNYLAAAVGGDIHTVNVICAIILVASILQCARLVEVDPSYALFLAAPYLLFVVGMGYTRQSVAIGLGICALGYLGQGRYRKFYLFAIFASLFHYSALALVVLVWLNSWRRAIVAVIAGLALIHPAIQVLSQPRYGQYVSEQSSGVWFRLAIVLIGIAAIFVFRKHWSQDTELYKLIKKAAAACIILIPLATVSSTLADRLCLYLFLLYIMGLGRAIRYAGVISKNIVLVSTFAFSFGVFALWFSLSSYAAAYWIPYRSILVP